MYPNISFLKYLTSPLLQSQSLIHCLMAVQYPNISFPTSWFCIILVSDIRYLHNVLLKYSVCHLVTPNMSLDLETLIYYSMLSLLYSSIETAAIVAALAGENVCLELIFITQLFGLRASYQK